MSFWILTETGNVISRTTVQRVTNLELTTAEVRQRVKELLKDNNLVVPEDDEQVL